LCLLSEQGEESRFSFLLLFLFPITIWIANISVPTSSPLAAPGPVLGHQQTPDPPEAPISQEGNKLQPAASGTLASDLKVKVMRRDFTKLPPSTLPASSRSCPDLHSQGWKRTATISDVTTGRGCGRCRLRHRSRRGSSAVADAV